MDKSKKLLKEVREILDEGTQSLALEGQILYDKLAKQFSIKVPKEIALSSGMRQGEKIIIVARPNEEDLKQIKLSNFIIYGKKEKFVK